MKRIGFILIALIASVGCRTSSSTVETPALSWRAPQPLDASMLWTPLTAPTITSTNGNGSFVYDSGHKSLVFFSNDSPPQLWTSADAKSWSQVTQGTTWPGALNNGQLVYDSKNGYIWALTEGSDGMDSTYWNSATNVWTPMSVYGTHPTGRGSYGAIYDPMLDRILMYGGGDIMFQAFNDYYSLDPNPSDPFPNPSWATITLTNSPPGGQPLGMSWDAAKNVGRFFGSDGNLYQLDATSVTKTSTTTLGLQYEQSIACAGWDPGIGRWVAFGVPDASSNGNNVYEHDDALDAWNVVSTGGFTGGMPNPGLPPAFQWCQLVWYPPLDGLVLIGLVSGASAPTWQSWVYKEGWTPTGPGTGGGADMGGGGGGGGGTDGGAGAVAPKLDATQTYNHTGVVGQPWVPSFSGSQSSLPLVEGTPPFTVNVSSGGEPFVVDANTLSVTWAPAAAGAKSITITVSNSAGSASLTLDVNVIATTLPPPTAMLAVSPTVGPAPLAVTMMLTATPGSAATAVNSLIDFGDGSPPSYVANTQHAYPRVAGYQVKGTFWQNDGQEASSKVALAVTTAGGIAPPTVTASATPVDDMTVGFAATAQAGTNPVSYYSWDFGDGATAVGPNVQHAFANHGSYSVTVVATDSQSYWGADKVLVVLGGSGMIVPSVRASATPATGDGPLMVTLTAQASNVGSSVSAITWDFGDGSTPVSGATLTSVQHTYNAGAYTAHLTVQTASGAEATDQVPVMVTQNGSLPPQIITVGNSMATVGMPYAYDADLMIHARSEGPVSYSTGPGTPSGLRVDAQSGAISWTPADSDAGTQRITLLATSAGGVDTQSFNVTVAAASKGHGCSFGGDATPTHPWTIVLLMLLALAPLRRRLSR